ncbi:MAG: response regulator [Defluviitaleaceae bacterium]|nr:response regulator [Defluviitaleaceae bacterium]MCL2262553.1 response regulator [Defluviitaleaceae bacterium]
MKSRLDNNSNLNAVIKQLQKENSALKMKIALAEADIAKKNASAEEVHYMNFILQNTTNILFLLDLDKKFVYASKIFLEKVGVESLSLLSGKYYKDVLKSILGNKNMMRLSGAISFGLTQSMTTALEREVDKDGEASTYTAHASPIIDAKGRHTGILVLLEDITEIDDAIMAAKRANDSRAKFLATMSHELRTPMNAIIGISDIELDREDHSAETKSAFEKIYNSGKTLMGIINDVLDLSQMQAGKLELSPVKYDAAIFINDIIRLNVMRLEDKEINFTVKIAENLPAELIGDDLRVKQAINNVLGNAIKFTGTGSVVFEVKCKTTRSDAALTFIVRDTGQGMKPEQLKALFSDDFTAYNHEANRKSSGAGLGMDITRNILDLMHGKISAESDPDMGTSVTIKLVQKIVDKNKVIGAETAASLANFKFGGMKRAKIVREFMPYGSVLIVDDMKTNLFVASGLMQPYGLQIDTALSGREAIGKIRDGKKYDIIFMDHMMPDLDGMETTKLIREENYTLPVIALTANAVVGQDKIFLQNGFDDFIAKPIDTTQLNDILNIYIRDKQSDETLNTARQKKERGEDKPAPSSQSPIDNLKKIKGLDVDTALDAMSGLPELYVDTVKLTIKLLPERIQKMDSYLSEDIKAFTIEVHGLKSALKNIGASKLGNYAAKLERAALDNDTAYCNENYPPFKTGLTELENVLRNALPEDKTEKKQADKTNLLPAIAEAKTAAESYDRDAALEILSQHTSFSYDDDTDGFLKEIISALEAFDCDGALNKLNELEEKLK